MLCTNMALIKKTAENNRFVNELSLGKRNYQFHSLQFASSKMSAVCSGYSDHFYR